MTEVPLISNVALSGLPEIFEAELGRRAVQRANRAAGIDFEAIADRHAFVPQAAVGRSHN